MMDEKDPVVRFFKWALFPVWGPLAAVGWVTDRLGLRSPPPKDTRKYGRVIHVPGAAPKQEDKP